MGHRLFLSSSGIAKWWLFEMAEICCSKLLFGIGLWFVSGAWVWKVFEVVKVCYYRHANQKKRWANVVKHDYNLRKISTKKWIVLLDWTVRITIVDFLEGLCPGSDLMATSLIIWSRGQQVSSAEGRRWCPIMAASDWSSRVRLFKWTQAQSAWVTASWVCPSKARAWAGSRSLYVEYDLTKFYSLLAFRPFLFRLPLAKLVKKRCCASQCWKDS